MRILLIDDDPSTRRLLDAMLGRMGHDVVHASDGQEAWELLQVDRINFVLSDWRMPRMDGVELCRRLRSSGNRHYTYVVLFTGNDQDDDMIVAMQAGADDFLTKPVQARELEVRIEAGRRVLELEQTLNQRNQQLEVANKALESSQRRIRQDLEAAAAIQQDLLPCAPLDGYPVNLAWDLLAADELAGDIFNFFALDDDHLGFYLADVSGHGVPAAMLSVHIAKTLSAEPREDSLVRLNQDEITAMENQTSRIPFMAHWRGQGRSKHCRRLYREPSDVAARLNSHFQDDRDGGLYFTMVYGVLNTRTGAGSLCQAGHPYPLICRSDGSVERLGSGGFPIGLISDADYEPVDFQLQRGDRLLVYSDGITECFNPLHEAFGEDRLVQCLSDSVSSPLQHSVERIKSNLSRWCGGNGSNLALKDDASMLAIEWP